MAHVKLLLFDSYLRDSVRARGHFRAKGDARSMNLSQSDQGIRLGGRYRPTNSDFDKKCALLRQGNEVLCIRTSGIIRPIVIGKKQLYLQ